MERYFFITYISGIPKGQTTGNLWCEMKDGRFPNNEWLRKNAKGIDVVITNIFEFKSFQDYIDFTRKSE